MSWSKIWEFTLKKEGGFQQLPDDSANYCSNQLIGTKYGISAIAYKSYFGVCPTVEQIKNLSEQQAEQIAYKNYFVKSGAVNLQNAGVQHLVFQEFFGSGYAGMKRIRQAVNNTAKKQLITVSNNILNEQETRLINTLDQKILFDNIFNLATEYRKTLTYGASYLKRWNEIKNLYNFYSYYLYLIYAVVFGIAIYLIYKFFK